MSIKLKEKIPGINQAKEVQLKILKAGIEDVKLFHDNTIIPHGMWCVVQVKRNTSRIIMPDNYKQENLQPMIMWWCKDPEGRFRVPNDNDAHDVIVIVQRAKKIWAKGGDKLDDEFVKQDEKKQEAYEKKKRDRIHAIAPEMKKAIRRELT